MLASPSADSQLRMPLHPSIAIRQTPERPNFIVRRSDFLRYAASAARLALRWRPDIVYASDPLAAGPGLMASKLAASKLVYHEHDTPARAALHPWIARMRAAAARAAAIVVFPNAARAELAREELGFSDQRLRIVWNMPRRSEIPEPTASDAPLAVYFHGSITPDRLPLAVIGAILALGGAARLEIAGYEAPLMPGYLQSLLDAGKPAQGAPLVRHLGQISRAELLQAAARNHIGLAFMPLSTREINMSHMTGASNKAFDYMAAGLALLVSDLPDWREMYVAPGFGLACDPSDLDSVTAALRWFLEHSDARQAMAKRARQKISEDWNYDTAFYRVLAELVAM
jgi:glycosyltransferase involved in cell wall biosynthesis